MQLQAEVVPGHVQVELVAKYLADLVDVENLDQVDGDENLDLEQDALLGDGERSVVRGIVTRLDNQRAIVLVREVVAVGELVAALLHRDTSTVAEAGELLQGADGHESLEGVEGVGETDVLVELPSLGAGAHVHDRCHAASVHRVVDGGEHPGLRVLVVLDDAVQEALVVGHVGQLVPPHRVEDVNIVVLAQTSEGGARGQLEVAHTALTFLLTTSVVVPVDPSTVQLPDSCTVLDPHPIGLARAPEPGDVEHLPSSRVPPGALLQDIRSSKPDPGTPF